MKGDLLGRRIKNVDANSADVNLTSIEGGTYIVSVLRNGKIVEPQRV
jgi:hypothetical protein